MSTNNKDYVPILKTKKDAKNEAINQINEERSGKQLGLYCRFNKLNIALGKYWRFNKVILIAGLSGHGKSALLNMLLADFTNKELNKGFGQDVVVIHNTFEMMPVDEVLRTVSSKVEKSTLYLLSAEFNDKVGKYNEVTDLEVAEVELALSEDENLDHYYFEEPTNVMGLIKNIECSVTFYKEKQVAIGKYSSIDIVPNPKIVIAVDHTLLINQDKGDTVIDTMTKIGKMSVWLKKKGYMVILVGQFNSEIEKAERIKNSDLHFPIKSDIYAQAQIYNACDIVLTTHQPELLGILEYGKNKFLTSGLFHLQVLKQRFGKVGSIWLQNQFERGKLIDFKPISNKVK